MAAPRSSTAFAKTSGTTTSRKSPISAAKKAGTMRATEPPAQQPPTASPEASRIATDLHELQVNADALSAQIARLADRFL